MSKGKSYKIEFKEQVIKECQETGDVAAVARRHEIPLSTVHAWIKKDKNRDKAAKRKTIKNLERELADAKLENAMLKELLKKSHQLRLKE